MQVEGKVVIVTGAAQGIGKAIVERFVAAGAKVVLADTQVEKGRSVAAQRPIH